jgi:hypothetical protein
VAGAAVSRRGQCRDRDGAAPLPRAPRGRGVSGGAVAIRRASVSRFYAQSGLFAGRAGMLLALADGEMWDTARHRRRRTRPRPTEHGRGHVLAGVGAVPVGASPGLPPRRGVLRGRGRIRPRARVRRSRPGSSPRCSAAARTRWARCGAWAGTRSGTAGCSRSPGDQLHRISADLATGGAGVLLALGRCSVRVRRTFPSSGRPTPGAARRDAAYPATARKPRHPPRVRRPHKSTNDDSRSCFAGSWVRLADI